MFTNPPKSALPFALVFILCGSAFAQNATLRGFVSDGSSGQAIELVNVILEDEAGTFHGAITRPDGLYQFSRIPAGRYEIRATFIGFSVFSDTLTLIADEIRNLNISLEPSSSELDEVVVEAQYEASVAAPIAGLQTVRPADIDRMPTPDVSGDLASYLTTLPGIVATGDQGGQLFIRGGEPAQNMVLIDGILVYQPFHILGFYSAFPSDIISKADIYAGGFGSRFGGRLSSVIDIRSREGNLRSYSGSGSLSPFLGSFRIEGPLIPGRMSVLTSYRQSLLGELASQYVDDDLPFEFSDVFGKLQFEITPTSKLSATYLKTTDKGVLQENTGAVPPQEIQWENEAIGMRLLMLPRNFAAAIELRVSHSRMNNELNPADSLGRSSTIENTQVSLEANFLGENVDFYAGFDLRPISLTSRLGGLYQNVEFNDARIGNWGNYLEIDIKAGSSLRVQPSLRAQFYKVRFKPYLEPRLRLLWQSGNHRISAATGIHHQEILGLTDRRDAANVFTAWTNIPDENSNSSSVHAGRIQKAIHGILGYGLDLGQNFSFSVEGFYKKLSNLFIAEWTAFPRFTTRLQPATGRSAGVDARLEFQRDAFYSHLNYAFSATRYAAEQASISIWYGVESLEFRPPHDRRHQANILFGTRLLSFDLSARWTFGSGLPFSRAIGFDGFTVIEDIVDVGQLETFRRVIYERPFSGALPHYHRLDVSIERVFELGRMKFTVQGSVLNAYNRRNIFYLDVFTLQRVDQLPIIPSLGVKVEFQ